MNIGLLLPGFSSDENDWAIPVQQNLARVLAFTDDVRVLALRYPHRRDRYAVHGAEVTALGFGQARGYHRIRLWLDTLQTLRRLHAEKPFDVLHAMWADETGLIAAWAGKRLRVPVVVSVLGGELARLDSLNYGLQRGAFSRWIVGQALYGADAVVVVGEYARSAIAAAGYRLADGRLRVIPLGVDTSRFHPADEPRDNRRLLHVASLVPVKDQPTLLRAFARLPPDTSLDIVGDGPERARLQSLAADLGVAERVNFRGPIAHPDLPSVYRRSYLHVLTSRNETQSMTTLEAAACGIPTVATAVGALPDYPVLGITSVPVGDDAALAAVLQDLLAHPDRVAALGAAARQEVLKNFTIERTAERLRALYRELSR